MGGPAVWIVSFIFDHIWVFALLSLSSSDGPPVSMATVAAGKAGHYGESHLSTSFLPSLSVTLH